MYPPILSWWEQEVPIQIIMAIRPYTQSGAQSSSPSFV